MSGNISKAVNSPKEGAYIATFTHLENTLYGPHNMQTKMAIQDSPRSQNFEYPQPWDQKQMKFQDFVSKNKHLLSE